MVFALVVPAIALALLLAGYFFGSVGVGALLILGVALALLAAVFVIVRQSASGRSRGAAVSGWQAQSAGGRAWQWRFDPGRRGRLRRASMRSLRMRAPLLAEIEIKREHWFDQLCKQIGIAREFQTGDDDFDRVYYIRGEIDSLLAAAMKLQEVRDSIRVLFDDGCTELRLSRRWLQADWRGFDADGRHHPGERELEALATIVAQLPMRTPQAHRIADRWLRRGVLWVLSIGFGAAILLGLDYPPVRWWPLLRAALPWAVGIWLLLAWIAAWTLRGQSRSHDHWGAIVGVGAITVVLGSIGTIQHSNGAEDPSPVVVLKVPVIEVERRRGRRSSSYHAVVADWLRPGRTLSFRVNHPDYFRSQSRQLSLVINTRAGGRGIEWYQGYALDPD